MSQTLIDGSPSRRGRGGHTLLELLSSMRFAIALLTVICIASVIGTVLKQHEPINNYINQFGPFWTEVFGAAGLFAVYSAGWFLLILGFLVLSTSLCIARNAPKIWRDVHTFKEGMRERSLRAFAHRASGLLAAPPAQAAQRVAAQLRALGFRTRAQVRERGVMVAARSGVGNKLGYLAAHSAIVLVCVGGLLDGDLIVRAQMWWANKTPYEGGGVIAQIPQQHRLPTNNPAFRGNLFVPEGASADTLVLVQPKGVLLQELPFAVELKRFIVEHYPTGMPKLFASEIVIHDKATGQQHPTRVEVNHPASFKGMQIYQSSFDDGGSTLNLSAQGLTAATEPFVLQTKVGEATTLQRAGGDSLRLEITGLRVINVERLGGETIDGAKADDARAQPWLSRLQNQLGAGTDRQAKTLHNVGPSFSYKLRDAAGQAKEFNNYMLPVDVNARVLFLFGVRDAPSEPYRYLRIPADDQRQIQGFLRLKRDLADPALRAEAVDRYVQRTAADKTAQARQALRGSALRALALFAGDDAVAKAMPAPDVGVDGQALGRGGLSALSYFLDQQVPVEERARVGETLVTMINAVMAELIDLGRARQGLPAWTWTATQQDFLVAAVLALSDAFYYPAPMSFMLEDFKQVQASVFQVTRAPGKTLVYLGCLLLIVGVFAMLYIREQRVWVWLTPSDEAQTRADLAFSVNRRVIDIERRFAAIKQRVLEEKT